LLLSICVLVLCQTGHASPLFYPAVNYRVDGLPTSVAIGDLDGDGHLDLAVTSNSLDSDDSVSVVSVLLNNGDGTFQAPVNYSAAPIPVSVAIGDLDGDGDLDLTATGGFYVSVLLNNGDGTFQAPVIYELWGVITSVAIGDLDGDGDLDLAVAKFVDRDVSVLLGNGDGTFQAPVHYNFNLGVWFVAMGDLDGDGDLDLAVINGPDEVSILLNNGDGTFQLTVWYGVGGLPISLAIGDLDGDDDLDLAVASGDDIGPPLVSGNVSVLLNNGDGTFQAAVNDWAGIGPTSVAIEDLDGDGYLDLAVANVVSTVSVLINRGMCFIATAAYGSRMADEVNILKDFRDHVLLTNSIGKAFVKFYYKVSPPLADFISKHDNLRAIARLCLYPLIGLSWIALKVGTANILLLFVLLGSGLLALGKYRSKSWQV
jgi:hypothetical protein